MIDTSMYDFITNDEDELMLLLYVNEGEPQNPSIEIDFANASAVVTRREGSFVTLQEIPNDILDTLEELDKLLICEMTAEEDETKTEIVYAYEAEIID